MDSQLWKINDTAVSGFAKDLQLTLCNQEPDRLTFNADGRAFDSPVLFFYGDSLSLYKGDVRWFAGVVLSGPRFGNPSEECHDYEIAGPWWYLANLVFQQYWRSGSAGDTISKGHVILGRDIDHSPNSVGAVIQEALDYAISKGAPFTYDIDELALLSAVPPTDEQVDLACSEVIRKMIRWYPDVVAWFDYAPAQPVLHFTRRANAPTVQYNCTAGKPVEQIKIINRDDLVRTGVIINYERIDVIDGENIPYLWQDVYPPETTPGFDTASFTINLLGSQLTTQSIEVEVDEAPNPLLEEFWEAYASGMSQYDGFVVVPGSATCPTEMAAHPNVLVSGQVPPWTNKSVARGEFTAKISGTLNGVPFVEKDISCILTLTNAETHKYTREVNFTFPELSPVGLAQVIFEGISQLHFQGRFDLLESEVSGGINPGHALCLDGGLPEWAAMRAVIQQVGFDLDTGLTTIVFGPPEHLGPQDHIDLLHGNRSRITLYSSNGRASGEGSSDLDTGGAAANHNGGQLNDVGLPSMDGSQQKHMSVVLNEVEIDGETVIAPAWDYRKLQ